MKINRAARSEAKTLFRICRSEKGLDEARVRQVVTALVQKKPRGYLQVLGRLGQLVRLEVGRATHEVVSAVKLEDGRPFTVSRRYGLSLHEKAALYKDLKSYGKKAPPANLDLETLIGKPCTVLVVHAERDGSTFANVQARLPAGPKKLTVDKDFLRKKDRSATGGPATVIGTDDGDGNTVPF